MASPSLKSDPSVAWRAKQARLEARVLAAVPATPVSFEALRAAARMDHSTCRYVVRRLVSRRLLDVSEQRRGQGGGSGAPRLLYARAEVAACA